MKYASKELIKKGKLTWYTHKKGHMNDHGKRKEYKKQEIIAKEDLVPFPSEGIPKEYN